MESITTILQVYKRPQYLSEQLEAIRNQTMPPSKIIIVHNEGGVKFNYPEGVEIIYSNPNRKYHLRFTIGLLEDSEYLAFFDDDTIPADKFFETSINLINKENCIAVGNGRVIHQEEKKWDCPGWGSQNEKEVECDFGGHAWILKKEHLKYMWMEDSKKYDNCEDMQISFNCFRFGKIRTFVTPHPISNKKIWSSLKGNEYGSDSVASWIVNKEHFQERWETIDKYIKSGYIPLIKRNV